MAGRRLNRGGLASLEKDLLLEVFRLLPPKTLAFCAAVCSSWHRIISSDCTLWEHSCRKQIQKLYSKFPLVKINEPREGNAKAEALRLAIYIRHVYSDTVVCSWQAHSRRINCCQSLMDTLVTGSSDNTVKVWSSKPGFKMQLMEEYKVLSKMDVIGVEFDGARIMAGAGPDVYIWRRGSSKVVRTLGDHNQRLYSMCYIDPEVLVGCKDGTIRYFDLYTGRCSLLLRHHKEPVTSIAMSSSLQLLATGSYDCTIQLCDPTSGEKIASYFPTSTSGVSCIQMLDHGSKLVAGTVSGTLDCWDIRAGRTRPLWSVRGSSSAVNCIGYEEYGSSIILVGGSDGRACVISSQSGKLLRTLDQPGGSTQTHRSPVLSIATGFSRALTCHADGRVTQHSFAHGDVLH